MANDADLYRFEVPFESFVKPLPPHLQTKATRDALFHQFARLPAELQLHIVQHCDAPTIWQLMRTTPSLRKEAITRFWNHADVWYQVDNGWFESRKGGYRHISDYHKSFWHNIKQIVFPAQRLEWDYKDGKTLGNGMSKIEVKITHLWEMVRTSFPSVKRILLMNYNMHGTTPGVGEKDVGDWSILRMVIDGAPKALDAKLVIESDLNRSRTIDSLGKKQNSVASNRWSGWKLLEEQFWRPTIRVVKFGGWDLPEGPLRRYETMNYVVGIYHLEWRLFRDMLLDTHTRYSRSGSFRCPVDDCDEIAESEANWHRHIGWRHHMREISWASETPQATQDFLEYKKARANHLRQRYEAHWLSIRKDMGDYGSLEWDAYIDAIQKEVEHYLVPPSCLIQQQEVSQYMHNGGFTSCFDPTHVYYRPAIQGYDKVPGYDEVPSDEDDTTNTALEVGSDDESSEDLQPDPGQLREVIERHDRFWTRAGFVPRDTRSLEQPSRAG